jgi:hypothetical protein
VKQPIKVTLTVTDVEGMRMEVTHVQGTNARGDITETSTQVVRRATNDANTWLRKQARLAARMPAKSTITPHL